jgi:hypothetical protein
METFDDAIRFLSELCDEHNAMMRSRHWLPTEANREKHEKRELGICDALAILREHNDVQEGRIESLTAALNEREDDEEHVDVFAEEPDAEETTVDLGDETEAMEQFEAKQREADARETSGEPEGESCAPCAAARAAADAALEG